MLNFLEQQQREVGNVVIKYSPWGVSTEAELWKDFGKALMQGLKANNLKRGFFASIWHWVKVNTPAVANAVKRTGVVAETAGLAPGAKVGAEVVSNFMKSRLKIGRQDIDAMAKKLGSKRLVVFIDDLDRTDPSVVPKLLLVLKELLDFKQIAFVLAFDKEIITRALANYNDAWGGENFLEKVIDFQITLPAPTAIQIEKLAAHQFERLCPFVPKSALKNVTELLPSNPRKLKLLARSVHSIKDEVARHEADELDWDTILLIELFRVENDQFVKHLLRMSTDPEKFKWLYLGPDKGEQAANELADNDELFACVPISGLSRARLEKLTAAWRQRLSVGNSERLVYQGTFALAPHLSTWREFNQFFEDWRVSRSRQAVLQFLEQCVHANRRQPTGAHEDFAVAVLGHYARLLERVSNVDDSKAHRTLVDAAADTLDLFNEAFCGAEPIIELNSGTLQQSWDKLYEIALNWAHFVKNAGEPELRAKELATLIKVAATYGGMLTIFERVAPVVTDDIRFETNQRAQRALLTIAIRQDCESQALSEAYEFIKQPGLISRLRSNSADQGARFLLTSPKSVAFQDNRTDQMLCVWNSRRNTDNLLRDALTFLGLLLLAYDGRDRHCSREERIAFCRLHPKFIVAIWDLCIARQCQYRMLVEMRRTRDGFVTLGVDAASLSAPDWLAAE